MVLVSHHHDTSIAELRCILVFLSLLQAEDFFDGREFFVCIEFLNGNVADIEEFSLQREYTPTLTADFLEA